MKKSTDAKKNVRRQGSAMTMDGHVGSRISLANFGRQSMDAEAMLQNKLSAAACGISSRAPHRQVTGIPAAPMRKGGRLRMESVERTRVPEKPILKLSNVMHPAGLLPVVSFRSNPVQIVHPDEVCVNQMVQDGGRSFKSSSLSASAAARRMNRSGASQILLTEDVPISLPHVSTWSTHASAFMDRSNDHLEEALESQLIIARGIEHQNLYSVSLAAVSVQLKDKEREIRRQKAGKSTRENMLKLKATREKSKSPIRSRNAAEVLGSSGGSKASKDSRQKQKKVRENNAEQSAVGIEERKEIEGSTNGRAAIL